jgi:uncharacterized protein HemX
MGEQIPDYELNPEEDRTEDDNPRVAALRATVAGMQTVLKLMAVGIVAALAVAGFSIYHAASQNATVSFQATRIKGLESASTRMAGQLAELANRETQTSARLSADDPSQDGSIITCTDLAHVRLPQTNTNASFSVSSVPGTGSISLGTSSIPFPLPAHCKAK